MDKINNYKISEENDFYQKYILPSNNSTEISQNYQDLQNLEQITARFDKINYDKTISQLKNKIIEQESQIKFLLSQKNQSLVKNNGYEFELESLQAELQNQLNSNKELVNMNQQLESNLSNLQSINKKLTEESTNLNDETKIKIETLNKELEEKNYLIENLIKQIKTNKETINYYIANNKLNQKCSTDYKEDLDSFMKKNTQLTQKISDLEKQINNLYIEKQSEGSLLLEIEQLKEDNIRLLQMLKSMEQLKDLKYFGQNAPGGLKFIRPYEAEKKNNLKNSDKSISSSYSILNTNTSINNSTNSNKRNIMLSEALNYAVKTANKLKLKINKENLKIFVIDFSKFYQEKYNKEITVLKNNFAKNLNELREQQLNNNNNYNNKNNNTLISSEIQNLKNNANEYNKGSLFMVERCVEEMENLDNNLMEIFQEYDIKIKKAEQERESGDIEYKNRIVNNAVKWFFTTLKSMLGETKKKMEEWENEIKKNIGVNNNKEKFDIY